MHVVHQRLHRSFKASPTDLHGGSDRGTQDFYATACELNNSSRCRALCDTVISRGRCAKFWRKHGLNDLSVVRRHQNKQSMYLELMQKAALGQFSRTR